MVVVGGFALLGQVTVGLDAVLEAVELVGMLANVRSAGHRIPPLPFAAETRARSYGAKNVARLTSQHELAIWQPAWPTVRVVSVSTLLAGGVPTKGGQGAWARSGTYRSS
jgi:hypothetical protein